MVTLDMLEIIIKVGLAIKSTYNWCIQSLIVT